MIIKKLFPTQIITLSDYPVFNEQVLKIYHRMFWKGQGKLVPPSPVIHIFTGIPFAKGNNKKAKKYNERLSSFLRQHPDAKYFLLDGSHKTTAAALAHMKIPVMIFKSGKDIAAARKLVEKGELMSLTAGGNSMPKVIEDLRKHFFKKMTFETVEEKTVRMVKNKVVPKYMIEVFKKGHS